MIALYNENEPFAADWLESLITHGHIAAGQVDRRSITELSPADVAGPGQRHFFAGIGGWSHALRLAGVPDDADIWTGSCPCQPFSDAGQGQGVRDPRHLWPAWFALIEQCRPPVIFGEQVASKDGLGWLDVVFADLERRGYTVGAADLCAAGVGAPHARQRLYFVAYADRVPRGLLVRQRGPRETNAQAGGGREAGLLADSDSEGLEVIGQQPAREQREAVERGGEAGGMGDAAGERGGRRRKRSAPRRSEIESPGSGIPGQLADRSSKRRQQGRQAEGRNGAGSADDCTSSLMAHADQGRRAEPQTAPPARAIEPDVARRVHVDHHGAVRGFWGNAEWLLCRDPAGGPPVARPVEPGTFLLASRIPGRVGLLSGYGNSIVPQVAAEFIGAALEAL